MLNTANTTRLAFNNPEHLSISVSQLLYPSSEVHWRANAVILISGNDFRNIVPAISLVHFPINAPVLFSNNPMLSNELFNEIVRLKPLGKDVPAQIILVGDFSPFVIQHFHSNGFSILHFNNQDPFIQSIHVLQWREKLIPQMMPEMITQNTFLISVESEIEALSSFGFSAHMGTPILYAYRDSLPTLTKQLLQQESHRNITIIGSEKVISKQVEELCRSLIKGHVERFDGDTLPQISVLFSRNKSKRTEVGWGRNKQGKGDAFTFFRADWRYAMIASPLSHLGKHTPLLPLPQTTLSKVYIVTLSS